MKTTLRSVVAQDQRYSELFNEAKSLSLGIADNPLGKWVLIPYFTDHSPAHLQAVEDLLDRLIFGGSSDRATFTPTPEEAMYLLSAVWLHDIGMYYGILPNEDAEVDDVNWEQVRDDHEMRSGRYIQQEWKLNCTWAAEQKVFLSAICKYHRRKHRLDRFHPSIIRDGSDNPVRLLELAALLRLADACHVDQSRSPADLRVQFHSMGMPPISRLHWQLPMQVSGVDFQHASRTIRPYIFLPEGQQRGTIKIDYAPLADTVVKHLEDELSSVDACLKRYSNVGFQFVEPNLLEADYLYETDGLLLSIWPLLLERVVSPSEAASLVATLVQTCVRHRVALPKKQISEIITRAKELQPYNVLLLRLARDVEVSMADEQGAGCAALVAKCKEQYLLRRVMACDAVAKSAMETVESNAVLIVSAYSHNVMTFVRNRRYSHGKVLVVRVDGTEPHSIAEAGYQRLLKELDDDRIPFRTVDLAGLPSALRHPEFRQVPIWCLLGCYGVIDETHVLAPVGSETVAVVAKANGAKVAILAESEKVAAGDELSGTLEELARNATVEVQLTDGPRPYKALRPNIDVLTKSMVEFELIGPVQTVNES